LTRKALPFLAAALFALSVRSAPAQDPTAVPETKFQKTLHRFDLGIFGAGIYNSTVSGPVLSQAAPNANLPITQFGSNTLGALITLRYIARPYVGLEYNYGYARYTENYEGAGVAGFTTSTSSDLFQVQTKAAEYTLGYVVTPDHTFFGLFPFVSAGAGTLAFKPTPKGGEEEPEKARMVYYYSLGVQQSYANGHFGLRAGFRELFFLDPDFGQNYLTILKHATTYEPVAGFYFRY
jgi:hypothetical protein